RIFGHFDWETIGIRYRAVIMSVVSGVISKRMDLESPPLLELDWWNDLKTSITALQTKTSDRVHVTEEGLARRLKDRFGIKLNSGFPFWQIAHCDLHWGNLTAPELSIIDWEWWGRAPYGFDVATLYVYSVAHPELVAK